MAKRIFAVVFLSFGVLVAACGGGGGGGGSATGPSGTPAPLTVVLRNSTSAALHMYVGTESADTTNLVQPGGALNRTFAPQNRETFDLQIFAAPPRQPNQPLGMGFGTSCRLSGSRNQTQVEVVVDGNGMRCVGW